MKVFYHQAVTGNVGDDLNAVLWHRLLPQLDQITSADWLVGIGTIIDERLNRLAGRKLVVGSGFRPGSAVRRFGPDVTFACVRGPLSAAQLGLPVTDAACDPGFLISTWPELQSVRKEPRVALIPHVYTEARTHVSRRAEDAGLEVISPALSVENFLRRLAGCARVYTESLHGAIFADALRIPWRRVKISSHYYEGPVADFKWQDAFAPLGLEPKALDRLATLPVKRTWPRLMRAARPLYALFERRLVTSLVAGQDRPGEFVLSANGRLEERVQLLIQRLEHATSGAGLQSRPA